MNLWVLDSDFKHNAVIDAFESLIWTDRYYKCGDFELVLPATADLLTLFRTSTYLASEFSSSIMVIEGVELKSDPEDGDKLTITGRSIESILDRRIVWDAIKFSGKMQDGILKIVDENCIHPKIAERAIPKMIFETIADAKLDGITVDFESQGDVVYDLIENLCTEKKIGFQVNVTPDNSFLFHLYLGTDRSYRQTEHDTVVFSNSFDNIVSSNYVKTLSDYRNVVMIPASINNVEKVIVVTKDDKTYSGLNRREATISASSDKNEESIKQEGKEFLTNNSGEEMVEGEVDASGIYQYGSDYFIGDIVELQNDYGLSSPVRVVEYVRNESESGIEIYPTFEVIDE